MALSRFLRFLCTVLALGAATAASAKPLDVSLDDRVDPVPVGEELVYEINVKVSSTVPAPGVVVALQLPPGTTFVSARRQPDYAPIAGQVAGDVVTFDLGDEPPCDKKNLPACADIWALVHVEPSVEPGTVLRSDVTVTSSDPASFPADVHTAYTSAGSLAIRKGRVNFAAVPGRDRIQIEGDVGRAGWESPLLQPPPNFAVFNGVRVRLGEAGGTPVLDVTVPGISFKCTGLASVRCSLADPAAWRPLGLDRLNVLLRFNGVQRNNAYVSVRTHNLDLPDDIGPEMELTLDANGETYTDSAEFLASGNRLIYTHLQSKP